MVRVCLAILWKQICRAGKMRLRVFDADSDYVLIATDIYTEATETADARMVGVLYTMGKFGYQTTQPDSLQIAFCHPVPTKVWH